MTSNNPAKACAYLLSGHCLFHKNSAYASPSLIACQGCNMSHIHHVCATEYADTKGLKEKDSTAGLHLCPKKDCLKKCYIVNDKNDPTGSKMREIINVGNNKVWDEKDFLEKKDYYVDPPDTRKAAWWHYFWLYDPAKREAKQNIAVCKLCEKEVSAKSGTGSLSKHLLAAHKDIYIKCENQSQRNYGKTGGASKMKEMIGSKMREIINVGNNKVWDEKDFLEKKDYYVDPPDTRKAAWWHYFWLYDPAKREAKQNIAVCKLCEKEVSAKSGTGSLSKHLLAAHKDIYIKCENQSQRNYGKTGEASKMKEMIGGVEEVVEKKKSHAERKKLFHEALTAWVVEENIPLNTVHSQSFRKIFDVIVADPEEKGTFVATNDSVIKGIVKLSDLAKMATKKLLDKKECCLTTDHWTGPGSYTYTTLTAHWINHDWELCSCIVDFKVFYGSTAGALCGKDLFRIFDEYDFDDDNIVIVITDTSASMITFGDHLRSSEKKTEHGFCADHNLHLTCKLAFDDENLPGSSGALSTSRQLAKYFTKSTQALTKLKDYQKNSVLQKYTKSDVPLKPLADVVTRWWSTCRMLKRLLFLKEAIAGVKASGETIKDTYPTVDQWTILEQVEEILRVPAKFQRLLEGEKCVTGSLAPYAIFEIRAHFVKVHDLPTTEPSVKNLAKNLIKDLDERYEPADDTGKVNYDTTLPRGIRNRYKALHHYIFYSAFLDPRMKEVLKTIMTLKQYNKLLGDVLNLMIEREVNHDNDGRPDNDRSKWNDIPATKKRKTDDFSVFFDLMCNDEVEQSDAEESGDDAFITNVDAHERCLEELNRFKKKKVKLRIMDASGKLNDPLHWWKAVGVSNFPILAKLARRFLPIPATSAPSERVWSRAANVLTLKHAGWNSDIAASIMFLRENACILDEYCKDNDIDIILPMIGEEDMEEIFQQEV